MPSIVLNDGNVIPQLGFGVFQVPPEDVFDVVTAALDAGYRSIDTAAIYGNEQGTGQAIRAFGLPRDEVYVTTKLWNADQGYDATLRAFDASMDKLGLDYLDLYLIHWPVAIADKFVETFRAFQELKRQGRVRSIGVSNFTEANLRRVIEETGEIPAVNQIELHPGLAQRELRDFHAANAIATEAWSPLGQGTLLEDRTITAIAAELDRMPAQVLIRWHLQLGNIVIPKSVTPSRIAANFDVFGFELTAEQMDAINALDRGGRIGPNPDTFTAGI
ncbi:2,5-diketo-D-gluconate reductase A [Nocardia amikacinitolerans]|uniref:2,5-diketo-D-gluconate reductase A n=1 Tax=Nocardia amikacinitolerans TaxID=756689 RepID=A0A285LSA0_9NOCA|nr:2,5-diketo-D-gluconate reductase A [Nocardia amikacinitolerans]MCP2295757.1 2,5-diketo-D-gluconate reductase A [Nocardia amikacinitolerans]SNY87802.1 2,5-diketo-D-gluconate reductase A [Nocardia amikacinitolerans]